MHRLKVPETFPRPRVEGEERVREEVRAGAVATVKVGRGRACGDVDDAACDIYGHPRPGVRAAGSAPRVRGPRLNPELAGPWDGVEGPADFSRARIVRAHVTGRGAFLLANARPLDEQILEDDTRARCDEVGVLDIPIEATREIDRTGIAEGGDWMAIVRVQGVQPAPGREEDPPIAGAVCPVDDAAVNVRSAAPAREWIEAPEQGAAIGAEGDYSKRRRGGVEHTIDDDRRRLNLRLIARRHVASMVNPGDAKLADIVARDLVEGGVTCVTRVAAGYRPVAVRQGLARASEPGGDRSRGDTPPDGLLEEAERPPCHRAKRRLCHQTARLSSPSAANWSGTLTTSAPTAAAASC